MRNLLLIIGIFVSPLLSGQYVAEQTYWLYFTDKSDNGYSIDQPGEFLTERSIERRAWQSLPLTETDLPVTQAYTDSLLQLGLSIRHTSKWLNGALVQTGDLALMDTIYEISFIDSVPWRADEDLFYELPPPGGERFPGPQTPPQDYKYGYSANQVKQIGIDHLHSLGLTGKGVYVAVLDGGFSNMTELQAFQKLYGEDRLYSSKNFVLKGTPVYNNSTHGTHVASVIVANWTDTLMGTAPGATLLLAVTENSNSETKIEEFAWIQAAEWADSLGADIINTSLGYTTFDDSTTNYSYRDMDGQTTFISRASGLAASKGILCVTSAGNQGNDPWYYIGAPGDAPGILTVGAVDSLGMATSFSSKGPSYDMRIKPEVAAMGALTAIQSASGNPALGYGTSYSSPVIAGAAASLWQAYPSMPVSDLIRAIISSAGQYRDPDIIYGFGIPDFGAAYHAITYAPTAMISDMLKVYPNPVSDFINLELPWEMNGIYQVTLYDIQGRVIYREERNIPAHMMIPGEINSGIYILEVINKERRFISRIIKN